MAHKITRQHAKAIEKLLDEIGDDGHTIGDPVVLEHFPQWFVEQHTKTYHSDGTGKGSITSDGAIVDSLEGVYGLRVLGWLCDELGLEHHDFGGRGYQAREYTRGLREWLKQEAN